MPLSSPSTPYTPTEPRPFLPPTLTPPVQIATTSERVSLTYCPIRVISDIDDTVKLSGVHCGARVVFQNVFVKDLEENLIPGMGEWYTEMWRRGVRFHYVVSRHRHFCLSYPKTQIVSTVVKRPFRTPPRHNGFLPTGQVACRLSSLAILRDTFAFQ